MSLQAGSVERRRLIETIRKKGDFLYNTDPMYNTGNFYVARRPYEYDHQKMVQGKINSSASSDENDDSNSDTEINDFSMKDAGVYDSSPTLPVSTAADCIKSTPKKKSKRRHHIGLTRICGNKIPWSDQEKNAALQNFGTYLEKQKLPSSAELSDALPNIPQLERRTVYSIKSWLENELKRRQICLSSINTGNENKIKRSRWSTAMKKSLLQNFAEHIENQTLPSNWECSEFIKLNPTFQNYTRASIKSAILNERRRRQKSV
ncbi:hypothetical protein RN001_002899 [Aquatica leii]|uniref:Uncharacterized protein n=1 Tax=Aquatica leii TaxID=1421715 RepID=A0AAN7PHU5_9COLE|nr:hypothetical protein RN001_002899 [Aquatica leii]